MRQKPLSFRTAGVCLFSLLWTAGIFAQTEKSNETSLPANYQTSKNVSTRDDFDRRSLFAFRAPKKVENRRRSSLSAFANAEFSTFSGRFSASSGSFASKRFVLSFGGGDGVQSVISAATGITPVGEIPTLEKSGLVSSNGQRPFSNDFTVDFLSANLGVSTDETSLSRNAGALPALTASGGMSNLLGSLQTSEIIVRTMSSVTEQRVAGAEINLSSRRGNNSFHGSLFEVFGSDKLNANDPFAEARGFRRPPARLNRFGAALGGFIRRDQVWFYGGYEGLRMRQQAFAVTEVPDLGARQTAFAPVRAVFEAFPLPNEQTTANGFAEFSAAFTNPATHDIFGLRIDAQPFNRFRIGGRYNFSGSDADLRGDRDFSLSTVRKFDTEMKSLSVWTSLAPGSSLVLDGRVNFSQNRIGQQFRLDDFGGAARLAPVNFDFLKYDLAGKNSAVAAGSPLETILRQFQTSGGISLNASRHQITIGADFRRLSIEIGAARNERSALFAGVNRSLDGTAARISELTRNLSANPELVNFSFFAQDNWRFPSRFNLTFGLRWDADGAPDAEAPNFEFQNAAPQMPDNLKNFAPRASVAFDPLGSGRISVRGGIGLFYDYGNSAASEIFANSYPFASGVFARNAVFNAAPTNALKPALVFDKGLRTPRALHVFAEYQQTLFRRHIFTATFTSSKGRKLFLTRVFLNADPDFNYLRLTDNEAESDFKSLEIRFERRFSQRFSYNARYVLAKSKDNFSPGIFRESNFVSADLSADRGASDFDARHQLSVYGVYDIPTFFAGGWAQRLTEDWSISGFAYARTAFPLTVGFYRVNDFGKEFVRADAVGGVPVYLNENAVKSLNRSAFSIPDANRQGTLGRNSLRGFPLFQLDTSLQRRIRFTNEMRLELAVNAYNLLNNTNFADMSGSLGKRFSNGDFLANPDFGKAVSIIGGANFTPFYLSGGARAIQLSAKFVF